MCTRQSEKCSNLNHSSTIKIYTSLLLDKRASNLKRLADLFAFLLPVFLSFDHGFDTMRERGKNPGRGGLERDRLSTKVNVIHVYWSVVRCTVGPDCSFDVRVVVCVLVSAESRGDGFGKGERIAPGSPVALWLKGAVCEWREM